MAIWGSIPVGEFELIEKIRTTIGKNSKRVIVGIGDDAAVTMPPKGKLLSTVDSLVEGIHFDLSYFKAQELGWKALAISLSDIAAMGGKPLYALVSIGIRPGITERFILDIYKGMSPLARKTGVDIIGGNLSRSPKGFFIDVVLLGEGKRPLRRSGAKVGDIVALTYSTGLSACGLALLQKFGRRAIRRFPRSTERQLHPEPRTEVGSILSQWPGVHSLIDISDGLSSELHHLAKASRVGFEIECSKIPVHPELWEAGRRLKKDPMEWVLHGGEDYELVFTMQPSAMKKVDGELKRTGVRIVVIGRVRPQLFGVTVLAESGTRRNLSSRGWTH